jgi:rubrerythrin
MILERRSQKVRAAAGQVKRKVPRPRTMQPGPPGLEPRRREGRKDQRMSRERDLTTLEVLGIAIKSEIEAIKLYHRIRDKANNPDLKTKVDFLIDQEKNHEKILTEAYRKRFPGVDLSLPTKSLVPSVSDVLERDATLKEYFAAAMEAEKKSEEFYGELAGKTRDQSSRSMLEYLASMERSHYSILEAEFRALEITEDYNTDDFLRGERLMNVGP